jgi:hypothetical protein
VSLDLFFADEPALADLDRLPAQDTGFDFSPPGPERDRVIAEAVGELRHHATVRALWSGTPLRSVVTLERAD